MDFSVSDIHFAYESDSVLNGVSMKISGSEIVGVLGPNGSGKTTFMKCLNKILTPKQGSIVFNGADVLSMAYRDVSKIMGYVPQNHAADVSFPTVYEIVMMGRRPYGYWRANSNDDAIVWDALEDMNMVEFATQRFNQLSSGQSQRVLMARAIAQEAKILLLDEPTSNLDVKYQREVMEVVTSIAKTKGVGVCAIIHDLDLALKYCDKGVLLSEGCVASAGPIGDVITSENIKKVYDVEVIIDTNYNRPHVMVP